MRALIFAAGLGTRLKPITDTVPKALVPVCSKPLLGHLIEKLKQNGYGDVVINLHHFPQQIKDYITAYDSSIVLSSNPAEWIKILRHDDAVNENIGYVSAMQIGNRTINEAAGIRFRDEVMNYNVKSPCFAIIYNGQYL